MSGSVEQPQVELQGRWHAALTFALFGHVPDGLAETGRLDLAAFLEDLGQRWPGGLQAARAEIARQRSTVRWPHVVPEDLRRGLGPAQFAAAVASISRTLGADPVATKRPGERGLDTEERRLQAEVPPHHVR